MKNNRCRFILMVLCIIAVLFSGCSKNTEPVSNTEPEVTPEPVVEPTPSPAPEPPKGSPFPLTGELVTY